MYQSNIKDEYFQDKQISEKEFLWISTRIYDLTGIKLGENKIPMVQARLNRRLKRLGISTYTEYLNYLENDGAETEPTFFINALTTNKTEFFREINHFEFLKNDYLHNLVRKNIRDKNILIWSAACSKGEEVYSLAMVLDEFINLHPFFDFRILGTDIDTQVLAHAKEGIYFSEDIKSIPQEYLKKYFLKERDGDRYKITNLGERIKFRKHNLIEYHVNLPATFDLIFIRNVLIYFDKSTIEKVINKMYKHLKPGGLLFIGHSETLTGISHEFENVHTSVYRRKK